ncbi:hypothetical protein [Cytobacillus sp. IB215665]|nr:hypothetical protein [Cytobacillus sp. IB215665]MDX8367144.1 hypothetical protein [Cytobacillus sp. IB215665]
MIDPGGGTRPKDPGGGRPIITDPGVGGGHHLDPGGGIPTHATL